MNDAPEFGFMCGDFSVVKSGNDIILPGSKNAPLKKSLLPYAAMDETAGAYTLRAEHNKEIICDIPVQVVWVGHKTQPEPFLGLQCDDVDNVIASLKAYVGKPVELTFTRRS
jgi:hypothetical protein